jgi:hypothetical protein
MPKIYIFATSDTPFGQPYIAMAEDGEQLCGHFCSNLSWAKSDMNQPKKPYYEKKYPNGYELEFLAIGELPPQAVLDKAEKINEPVKNSTEINIKFD